MTQARDLDSPLNQYGLLSLRHPDLKNAVRCTYAVLRAYYHADLADKGEARVDSSAIRRAATALGLTERTVWYDLNSIRIYLREKRLQ